MKYLVFGIVLLIIAGGTWYHLEHQKPISIAKHDAAQKGIKFNADFTILKKCPDGLGGVYDIPGCVTTIGGFAFANCKSLKSVTISHGVTVLVTRES